MLTYPCLFLTPLSFLSPRHRRSLPGSQHLLPGSPLCTSPTDLSHLLPGSSLCAPPADLTLYPASATSTARFLVQLRSPAVHQCYPTSRHYPGDPWLPLYSTPANHHLCSASNLPTAYALVQLQPPTSPPTNPHLWPASALPTTRSLVV